MRERHSRAARQTIAEAVWRLRPGWWSGESRLLLLQILGERIELPLPKGSQLLDPVASTTQRIGAEAAVMHAAGFTPSDEAGLFENPQVLRDGGRRHGKWFAKRAHGALALRQAS